MVALLGLAPLLAACGGSPAHASSASTTTTGAGRSAFTSCLESKGIPASAAGQLGFGRRGGGGPGRTPGAQRPPGAGTRTPGSFPTPSLPAGVTAQQYRTALQACRSTLPGGGFGGRGRQNSPAFAAYRNCLELHGVTLPARGAGGTTTTTVAGATTTTVAATTRQAAEQACASLRPATGAGSSTTTSGSSNP